MLTTFSKCNFSLEFPETLSKSYTLSLTEFVSEFRRNALWDSYKHALLDEVFDIITQSSLYMMQNIAVPATSAEFANTIEA